MRKYISKLSLRDICDFAFYNKIKRYTIYSSNGFYHIDIKDKNNSKEFKFILSDFEIKVISNLNSEKIETLQSSWRTFLTEKFGEEYLDDLNAWLNEQKLNK